MNVKYGRNSIEIYPNTEMDRAYIEDTLGLKKDGDYIIFERVNDCYGRLYYIRTVFKKFVGE